MDLSSLIVLLLRRSVQLKQFYSPSFVILLDMKYILLLLFFISVDLMVIAQYQVKRVDSLVSLFETSDTLSEKTECDTFSVSHTDFFSIICIEYYSNNRDVVKIVLRNENLPLVSPYPEILPSKKGIISLDIFFFENDSLIKATQKRFNSTPIIIKEYYFEGNDLKKMEESGLKQTDEYKKVAECIEHAHEIYKYIKTKTGL